MDSPAATTQGGWREVTISRLTLRVEIPERFVLIEDVATAERASFGVKDVSGTLYSEVLDIYRYRRDIRTSSPSWREELEAMGKVRQWRNLVAGEPATHSAGSIGGWRGTFECTTGALDARCSGALWVADVASDHVAIVYRLEAKQEGMQGDLFGTLLDTLDFSHQPRSAINDRQAVAERRKRSSFMNSPFSAIILIVVAMSVLAASVWAYGNIRNQGTSQSTSVGMTTADKQIGSSGVITAFSLPDKDANTTRLVAGSDGNLWFLETFGSLLDTPLSGLHGRIGSMARDGTVAEFPLPTPGWLPRDITVGPDGNCWFFEDRLDVKNKDYQAKIGRITLKGEITEYPIQTNQEALLRIVFSHDGSMWFPSPTPPGGLWHLAANSNLSRVPLTAAAYDMVVGQDGSIWFANNNLIGHVLLDGSVVTLPLPSNTTAGAIAVTRDGNIWFSDISANQIGRMIPSGSVTMFALPTPRTLPFSLAAGTDGNIWFAERELGKIGRILPSGAVMEFSPLPVVRIDSIAVGPDGNMWFSQRNKISRITSGIQAATVPGGAATVQAGRPTTGAATQSVTFSPFAQATTSAPGVPVTTVPATAVSQVAPISTATVIATNTPLLAATSTPAPTPTPISRLTLPTPTTVQSTATPMPPPTSTTVPTPIPPPTTTPAPTRIVATATPLRPPQVSGPFVDNGGNNLLKWTDAQRNITLNYPSSWTASRDASSPSSIVDIVSGDGGSFSVDVFALDSPASAAIQGFHERHSASTTRAYRDGPIRQGTAGHYVAQCMDYNSTSKNDSGDVHYGTVCYVDYSGKQYVFEYFLTADSPRYEGIFQFILLSVVLPQ